MGKLNALKEYVERFRCNEEETATAAALQLSEIDATQEESVSEMKIAEKSARPKTFQGETSSKKSQTKN